MKKKLILSVVSGIMAVSVLAACGDNNEETNTINDPAVQNNVETNAEENVEADVEANVENEVEENVDANVDVDVEEENNAAE